MYSSLKKTYSTIDSIKPLEKTYSTIKLEITTGKKIFSGTDDDIYLILWNTLPWSPLETLLHSDYKDTFENGQIDTFIVNPVAPYIFTKNTIKNFVIYKKPYTLISGISGVNSSTYYSDDWNLSRVRIWLGTDTTYTFAGDYYPNILLDKKTHSWMAPV